MQGALAGLPRPRNDMVTYSVPHGGLSRTGQLPPLLQAAGWERASPAGSVQISCPPHWWQRPSLARHQWVGKAMWMAWGGTWTDPRADWEHLKGWASKSCTIGHTGQKSGVKQCRGHWAGRREHCTVQWQHCTTWRVTNVSQNISLRRQQYLEE